MESQFRPENEFSKSYAPRIAGVKWRQFEPVIRQLHSIGKTRPQILMQLHMAGFDLSLDQLHRKMRSWGLSDTRFRQVQSSVDNEDNPSANVVSSSTFELPKDSRHHHLESDASDNNIPVDERYAAAPQTPNNDLQDTLRNTSLDTMMLPEALEETLPHGALQKTEANTRDPETSLFDCVAGEEWCNASNVRECSLLKDLSSLFSWRQLNEHHAKIHLYYSNDELGFNLYITTEIHLNEIENTYRSWVDHLGPVDAVQMLATADFLCASLMFGYAFHVYKALAERFLTDSVEPESFEIFVKVTCGCLRTANTSRQIRYARDLADAFLGTNLYPGEVWLRNGILERKIALDKREPTVGLSDLYEGFEHKLSVSRNADAELHSGHLQREKLTFHIQRFGILGVLQQKPRKSTLLDDNVKNYHDTETGRRLLTWCSAVLHKEYYRQKLMGMLEITGHLPSSSSGTRRLSLKDILFRFLLSIEARDAPPFVMHTYGEHIPVVAENGVGSHALFRYMETLAAFSDAALIEPNFHFSEGQAVYYILQCIEKHMASPSAFHQKFIGTYFRLIGIPAVEFPLPPTMLWRNQAWLAASLDIATKIAHRGLEIPFEFCEVEYDYTNSMEIESKSTAGVITAADGVYNNMDSENPRMAPAVPQFQLYTSPTPSRQVSYNDPILFQRKSGSSSLWSHLSKIIPDRMSTSSDEKRKSKASSRSSWRMSAYLSISKLSVSDKSSMHGSAMEIDEPMYSIEE